MKRRSRAKSVNVEVDGYTLTQEVMRSIPTAAETLRKRITEQTRLIKNCGDPHEKARLKEILRMMRAQLKRELT